MVGGYRAIVGCQKCPEHVKEEVNQYMLRKKTEKEQVNLMAEFDDVAFDEEEDEVAEVDAHGKRVQNVGGSSTSKKKPRHVGPMDAFVSPPKSAQMGKSERGSKQQLMMLTRKS